MAIHGQISFDTFANMRHIYADKDDVQYEIGKVYDGDGNLVWQNIPGYESYQVAKTSNVGALIRLDPCRLLWFSIYTISDLRDCNNLNAIVAYHSEKVATQLDGQYMTTYASRNNMTGVCVATDLTTYDGQPLYKITYTSNDSKGVILPKTGTYLFLLRHMTNNNLVISTGVYRHNSDYRAFDIQYYNLPGGPPTTIGTVWSSSSFKFGTELSERLTLDYETTEIFDDDPIPDATIEAKWDYMNENVVITGIYNSGADVSEYVDHYEYTLDGTTTSTTDVTIPISNMSFTGTDKTYTMTITAVSKQGNVTTTATSVVISMPVTMTFGDYDPVNYTLTWTPYYDGSTDYSSRIGRYIYIFRSSGQSYSGTLTDATMDLSGFEDGSYQAIISARTKNNNLIKTSYSAYFDVVIDHHTWSYVDVVDEETEYQTQRTPFALITPTETITLASFSYFSIYNSTPSSLIRYVLDCTNTSSRSSVATLKCDSVAITNRQTSDKKYRLYEYIMSASDGSNITLEAGKTYGLCIGQGGWNKMSIVWNEESTVSTGIAQTWDVINSTWTARTEKTYIELTEAT